MGNNEIAKVFCRFFAHAAGIVFLIVGQDEHYVWMPRLLRRRRAPAEAARQGNGKACAPGDRLAQDTVRPHAHHGVARTPLPTRLTGHGSTPDRFQKQARADGVPGHDVVEGPFPGQYEPGPSRCQMAAGLIPGGDRLGRGRAPASAQQLGGSGAERRAPGQTRKRAGDARKAEKAVFSGPKSKNKPVVHSFCFWPASCNPERHCAQQGPARLTARNPRKTRQ